MFFCSASLKTKWSLVLVEIDPEGWLLREEGGRDVKGLAKEPKPVGGVVDAATAAAAPGGGDDNPNAS